MRVTRPFTSLLVVLTSGALLHSQQSTPTTVAVQRDTQAVAFLQQSLAAFGRVPPSDSTATGNITVSEGSTTAQGTITILTRGSAQSSFKLQLPSGTWSIVYSNGQANLTAADGTTALSLERASSSQSLYFPYAYLSGILANPDYSIQLVGTEQLGNTQAVHLRVQNTFSSQPSSQFLSQFTVADIWLDATSNLPTKISRVQRDGGGATPKIPVSVTYSNYQNASGVLYAFTIQEYITDTLWATTTIQSVTLNSGLTDSAFPIVQGGN